MTDVGVLEQLETQFTEQTEHTCEVENCNEKAIYKRTRHICCGSMYYVCGAHKYGCLTGTGGRPVWPTSTGKTRHSDCDGVWRTWFDVLMTDEWKRL